MPQLDDLLWEAFARRMAEGLKKGAAMMQAAADIERPFSDVQQARNAASRAYANGNVKRRIRELMATQRVTVRKIVVDYVLGRQWIIDELMNTAIEAKKEKNWNASTKALELLGRELGMFATVVKATVRHDDPNELSDAELIAIITGGGADASEPPSDPSKLN
jgi:hypothetical protein